MDAITVADDAFVLSYSARNLPGRICNVSGIERINKQVYELIDVLVWLLLGPEAFFDEIPTHVYRALKGPVGKQHHRLCKNLSFSIWPKYLPVHWVHMACISFFTTKWPIARSETSLHLLNHLPFILFSLELALSGEYGLHKFSFRTVIEVVIKATQYHITKLKCSPKFEVELSISCKTLKVVKVNNKLLVWASIDIRQEFTHSGTLHEIAPTSVSIGKCLLIRHANGL
jgi:hypothetical protein